MSKNDRPGDSTSWPLIETLQSLLVTAAAVINHRDRGAGKTNATLAAAQGVTAGAIAFQFSRSRKPLVGAAAALDALLFAITVWLTWKSRKPYLWDASSNVTTLRAEGEN